LRLFFLPDHPPQGTGPCTYYSLSIFELSPGVNPNRGKVLLCLSYAEVCFFVQLNNLLIKFVARQGIEPYNRERPLNIPSGCVGRQIEGNVLNQSIKFNVCRPVMVKRTPVYSCP